YTPDLSERTAAWLPLETKLLGALEKDEFVLYYQPKVDTSTRRIVGLEALLRWKSADFGVVPPAKFIPLMEETGMILDVGACGLPSTTSAPVTPPSGISRSCRFRHSRSTGPSSSLS